MSGEFSWKDADVDGDIVLHAQPKTAVYRNNANAIVVRQEDIYGDDDAYIIIQPNNADAVARAILERAAESRAEQTSRPEPVYLVQKGKAGDKDAREPRLPLAMAAE
jgi:hypothetical protein